jgi:hypothetical protein
MLELLQKIIKKNITPNQLLLLYALDDSLSFPQINPHLEVKGLKREGYIVMNEDMESGCEITESGRKIMIDFNNYFIKAKKITSIQLMGKSYTVAVQNYREMFPKMKLPSGKPARVNIKTLIDCFRWFFTNYNYSWEEIYKATRRYLNEYEDNNYMYMKTSQYFIVKTLPTKEKVSDLADYCDMIREGVEEDDNSPFKERVV